MVGIKAKSIETPYDRYAKELGGFVNWSPFPGSDRSDRIQQLVQSIDRNDPATWFAFAADSIKMAWQALPEDLRREVFGMLNDLIQDAFDQIQDLVGDLGNTIGDALDAIPIIGAIIKAVVKLIQIFVDWAKIKEEANEDSSATSFQQAQFNTVKFLTVTGRGSRGDDPNSWVMERVRVQNYLKWMGRRTGDGDWALRPSMRNSLGVDQVFYTSEGKRDSGWCGEGVGMRCPEFWDANDQYGGCRPYKKGNEAYYCKRDTTISALFYPYWSPAYPAGPIPLIKASPDANSLLMSRQVALLSNPDANLRVKGRKLREKTNRFVNYFSSKIREHEVGGKASFWKINDEGRAVATGTKDRLLIDEKENPGYSPSQSNMTRFYFRPDGIIEPYLRAANNDPKDWGVIQRTGGLGISIEQYNIVVGMTNAFFASRANMLRDGLMMKGLRSDHGTSVYDQEVRAAMNFAASQGKILPVYSPLISAKPVFAPDIILAGQVAEPGGGGAGAVLGLGAAAAVAYFFMKK